MSPKEKCFILYARRPNQTRMGLQAVVASCAGLFFHFNSSFVGFFAPRMRTMQRFYLACCGIFFSFKHAILRTCGFSTYASGYATLFMTRNKQAEAFKNEFGVGRIQILDEMKTAFRVRLSTIGLLSELHISRHGHHLPLRRPPTFFLDLRLLATGLPSDAPAALMTDRATPCEDRSNGMNATA